LTDVWRPLPDWLGGEQPYDLNSWQESETALALADTLDEDAVIVEGYAEYATWRPHLAYLRDPYGDPDMEMEIDGVGGVSILAKAKVFRSGVHFPAFSFEKHAETEGFGKVRYTVYVRCFPEANITKDGQANEVFCRWSAPLHDLASLRAQCR
jgi:mannan polymerase II complex ANP1 subunit